MTAFKLKKKAVFHDGTPVTAKDVKWSLDRAVTVGGFPTFQMGAGSLSKPEQFVVVDDNTEVKECVPLQRLRLRAKGWPMGEANVVIELEAVGAGTRIKIDEDAAEGPGRLVPGIIRGPLLKWRNTETLRADGVTIVGPASGGQACGEMGMGRMTEPADIVADVQFFFQPKRLEGKRVVVTAGPTEEPVDPVRVLTNTSSGKMGYAVARAAREAALLGVQRGTDGASNTTISRWMREIAPPGTAD